MKTIDIKKDTFDNFFSKPESEKTKEEKELEFNIWKNDMVNYWRNYHLSFQKGNNYDY